MAHSHSCNHRSWSLSLGSGVKVEGIQTPERALAKEHLLQTPSAAALLGRVAFKSEAQPASIRHGPSLVAP